MLGEGHPVPGPIEMLELMIEPRAGGSLL